MFDPGFLGKSLFLIGLTVAVIGLALMASDKIPWLGRLPGDLIIRKEHWTFYFPITTGIVVSLLLSMLLWLLKR